MNYKRARPGKPGEWNGRPQRWRTYVRAMKGSNVAATERVAKAEIAAAEKIKRVRTVATIVRNALIVLIVAGAVAIRCAL